MAGRYVASAGAAPVRRVPDAAGVDGPPGAPPPVGRCVGAAGAAPVPCASDAGGVAGRAGIPPPAARYGRSAVSVPRASDAPRGRRRAGRRARGAGGRRWSCRRRCRAASRCGPCPRRAGRRTRGASPGRGRRCRHRSPYPRPMRRAPRGRRTRPAVAPCPCRRRRTGPSAAEACRPVASGGRTDPGCLRCGGRGAGAGEGGAARFRAHAPPFPRARAGPRRPRPVCRCQVARRGRVPGTDTRTTGASSRPDDRAGPVPAVRARHSTACGASNGNQSAGPRHLPGTSPYPAVIRSGRLRS